MRTIGKIEAPKPKPAAPSKDVEKKPEPKKGK